MEKKIIQFKGMSNVPDDQVAQDGQMAILLNARIKNGEIVPMGRARVESFELQDEGAVIKQAVYHVNSDKWLILSNKGRLMVFSKEMVYESSIKEEGVETFATMGNVISLITGDGVEYAIWRYNVFDLLGKLPEVQFTIAGSYWSYKGYTYNDYKTEGIGLINKGIAELNEAGFYIDRCLFKIALRMFDGNYIYVSNIIYMSDDLPDENKLTSVGRLPSGLGRDEKNFVINNGSIYIRGFKVNFVPGFSNLGKWKDIIVAIDVFSTKSIMGQEVSDTIYGYKAYQAKTFNKLKKDIEDETAFFKVASYDVNGKVLYELINVSPSNLSVQTQLIDSFNGREYIMSKNLNYNRKQHSCDGGYFPFKGYGIDAYYPLGYGSRVTKEAVEEMLVRVQTEEDNKKIVVERKFTNPELYKIDDVLGLSSFLSYPNAKASQMEFFIKKGDVVYNKSFPLEGHKVLDVAYYINVVNPDLSLTIEYEWAGNPPTAAGFGAEDALEVFVFAGTYEVVFNSSINDWTYNSEKIPERWKSYRIFQVTRNQAHGDTTRFILSGGIATQNILNIKVDDSWDVLDEMPEEVEREFVRKDDTLRVSTVDNPFYYPATQEYMFDNDVVAMASNAEAVSSGQFGQYPLYVFTKGGIWMMQVDSTGKMAYLNSTPVGGERCIGEVCPTRKGVAFATENGVMLITGSESVELSRELDAQVEQMFEYSKELIVKICDHALNSSFFATGGKPVPIREYIKDAKLAYNYTYNELIVSNEKYGFSYIYGFDSQIWKTTETIFSGTTNYYPELMVFAGDALAVFEDGDKRNSVLAITRPIKTDSFDYKRLRQAALRTTFKGSLNFYVLGSNDGATFSVITGKEYPSKDGNEPTDVMRRDLVTSMSRSRQYKYFAIAIAGNMEGRISMAELLMDAGFANNQLR